MSVKYNINLNKVTMAKFTTVDQNGVVSIVDIDTRIGIVFKEGNSIREKLIACMLPDHNDLKFSTTVEKINVVVEELIRHAEKRFPQKKRKAKRKR